MFLRPLTAPVLFAAAVLTSAPVFAAAQAEHAGPPPAAAAAAAVKPAPSLDDRVGALVQQGKCWEAKDEATSGGDPGLAEQVGAMCGLHPSTSDRGKGGGGRGGGGRGGGGRGGRGGGMGG